jgi:RNA polymerase sigma factor (sigma-70 family)
MTSVQQPEIVGEYKRYHHPDSESILLFTDAALIEQARAGDQVAFEALVERYRSPLYQFISRYFADYDQRCDLLQQVLIQLYISLPDLQTNRSLQAWIFRVARNRCLDELRHRHVPSFTEMAWEGSEDEALFAVGALVLAPSVEEQAEQHELEQLLRQVITNLPPNYRPIVWLRYTTLLNFGEIGRILHIPEATAKTYFQRAKLRMRQSLGELRR